MRNIFIAILLCLALPGISFSQRIIAAIGSSTTAGQGASTFDSSWVGRTRIYFGVRGLGLIDTVYEFGQPGATTAAGMPTGTRGVPGQYPTNLNISAVMALNPDMVIISFPSNDILLDTPMAAYLSNLRTIYNIVTSAGKIAYVTTTQPRTTFNPTQTQNLKIGRDSIIMEFGTHALDFYDPLKNPNSPDSLGFNPAFMSVSDPGDTIHPNDAGHALLFNVVKSNVVFSGNPLPLLLTGFTAAIDKGTAVLRWTTASEEGPTGFEVQKSADGSSFTTVHQESGKGSPQFNVYSWTDDNLLTGTSFYRLRITEPAKLSYSGIVSLTNRAAGGLIANMYRQGDNSLSLELNVAQNGPVAISVFTASGVLVARQSVTAVRPSALVSIPLTNMAAGVYFLKVTAPGGKQETRAFNRF